MGLLVDKWTGPQWPENGLRRPSLNQTLTAMAASMLSLWRKDRREGHHPGAPPANHSQPSPAPSPPRGEASGSDDWRRRVFDDGPIGIAILDPADRLLESNAAFHPLVGQTRAKPGQALESLLKPAGDDSLDALLATDSATLIDVLIPAPDGQAEERSGNLYAAPLTGGTRVIHLIDTTQQKKLEIQFTQSQKMLAVGTLAGGIAHDFNNLLTAMNGFCDLLLQRHQPGDPSFADIMQVKQNANRAANLVRQLLAFSRQQTLQPQVLNLADVISDLSNLLRRLLGAGIELEVEHSRETGLIRVDRGQLEQVLINLAVNARDAMTGEGSLSIRTRTIGPDLKGEPVRRPPLPAADWVVIEVTDTGGGIPAGLIDRIFEPFFTTKPIGEGTGLGLSTVYGIVKQTGGYIFADNVPGQGACFSVYLPVHQGDAEEEGADGGAALAADLTGAGTILLVEDEDPVRLFASRALRSKGYRVLEARTGLAALSLLEDAEEHVDLIVTDVVMPEMDGPALIEKVRAERPGMRIICISGYAEGSFREKLGSFRNIHFLPKPFTLSQLAERVKEVLGE
jgi:two-component system cell cycle sensor histidine kinase/response regulator CckA